jgi:catechol 2,3-dioxygenase-like lactoylglutathione lyase family enzyme
MEHIIAKLLNDFENGKMNRRQLIQALALAATAASAASSAPTAAAAGKGFKAIAVNHISFGVADYARTRDFYSDLLGMKVKYDDGKQCFLNFGVQQDCIIARKTKQPDGKPFVDHLAYTIDHWDRDAVEAELKRRGLDPKPDSKYAWTIHDPDGYTIQVCAKELQDYVWKTCGGSVQGCPGGPGGL